MWSKKKKKPSQTFPQARVCYSIVIDIKAATSFAKFWTLFLRGVARGVSWKMMGFFSITIAITFILRTRYNSHRYNSTQFAQKYRGPSEDSSFLSPFRTSPPTLDSSTPLDAQATGKAHNAPQSPPPKEGPKVCIRPAFLTQTNHNPIRLKRWCNKNCKFHNLERGSLLYMSHLKCSQSQESIGWRKHHFLRPLWCCFKIFNWTNLPQREQEGLANFCGSKPPNS